MKYLGTLGFIFIYRLKLPKSPAQLWYKSTYSMWIALPKPLVAEKSVVSITDQREYILKEQKEDFVAGWLAPIKVVCLGTTATFHIYSIQMGPWSDSS